MAANTHYIEQAGDARTSCGRNATIRPTVVRGQGTASCAACSGQRRQRAAQSETPKGERAPRARRSKQQDEDDGGTGLPPYRDPGPAPEMLTRPEWLKRGAVVTPKSGHRAGWIGTVEEDLSFGLVAVQFPKDRTGFWPGELAQASA